MKSMFVRSACATMLVLVAGGTPSSAQQAPPPAAVRLPVTGSFHGGGSFSGVVTINRFEQTSDNQIAAVGFVSGVLSRGSKNLGTAIAGEVRWPVAVRSGGQLLSIRGTPLGDLVCAASDLLGDVAGLVNLLNGILGLLTGLLGGLTGGLGGLVP